MNFVLRLHYMKINEFQLRYPCKKVSGALLFIYVLVSLVFWNLRIKTVLLGINFKIVRSTYVRATVKQGFDGYRYGYRKWNIVFHKKELKYTLDYKLLLIIHKKYYLYTNRCMYTIQFFNLQLYAPRSRCNTK